MLSRFICQTIEQRHDTTFTRRGVEREKLLRVKICNSMRKMMLNLMNLAGFVSPLLLRRMGLGELKLTQHAFGASCNVVYLL